MPKTTPGVSAVVPVYRSEDTLAPLVTRLTATLDAGDAPYEIILVNDGSPDDSWARIVKLSSEHPAVRGINLTRNFGQHNALLAGVRAARYDVVVTLDDDLQHPPEQLPLLLGALTDDLDVVYGAARRQHQSALRRLASWITRVSLQRFMGVEAARHISAFRAFRTQLRDSFEQFRFNEFSLDVLLTWGTTRFGFVTVEHEPRREGKSNYTSGQLVRHAINMVTGFTTGPLRLASLIGFGATVVGLAALAYVLGVYIINGGSVPGFAFIAASVAFFSGVQLFALGVIGEYLAKVHNRSMDRPAYVVRDLAVGGDEIDVREAVGLVQPDGS
jgi:undecaprenyl-phosphate 4-deoxy-4-formamido-L-arabinose transferase